MARKRAFLMECSCYLLLELGEEASEKEGGFLDGFGRGLSANGVQNEVDNGISEENDNETKNGIEDSVLGVGDLLAVAARDDVADTAPDQHNDRNETDNVEDDISELIDDAAVTDEFGRHTVGAGSLGAFLDAKSHDLASARDKGGD